MAQLALEGASFRLVVLGVGSEEQKLQARARELRLADRIRWEGFRSDVRPYLRQADIFVLPSHCEPLGIALQEAMAHGLVPVARRAGGVPEIWPADMESFLFPDEAGAAGMHAILSRVVSAPDDELLEWKRRTWQHAREAFDARRQARIFADWVQAATPAAIDTGHAASQRGP